MRKYVKFTTEKKNLKHSKTCNETEIPWNNIFLAASDGIPAISGHWKVFTIYLKTRILGVFAIHCVRYRQHLVARNLGELVHTSL